MPRRPVLRTACEAVGLNISTYWKRRRAGMSHDEALTTPVRVSLSRAASAKAAWDRRRQAEASKAVTEQTINQLLRNWRRVSDT